MHETQVEIKCTSAVDFINCLRNVVLEDRSPEILDRFIFRGQSNSEWKLIPSAFRQGTVLGFENRQFTRIAAELPRGTWDQGNAEWVGLMEFIRMSDRVGLDLPIDHSWLRRYNPFHNTVGHTIGTGDWPPKELYEALAIAQHHGVPTRLLDFSYDPLVAAFFAADDSNESIRNIAVWCVDLQAVASTLSCGIQGDLEIVTVSRRLNENLTAQKGLFLLDRRASRIVYPLERSIAGVMQEHILSGETTTYVPAVRKICLPITEAPKLQVLLMKLGVDRAHLMPSFPGVVRELELRLKRRDHAQIPIVGTE